MKHKRAAEDINEYVQRHQMVREELGSASDYECNDCDKRAVEWSLHHGMDPWSPDSYDPRCISCHRKYDAVLLRTVKPRRRPRQDQNIF